MTNALHITVAALAAALPVAGAALLLRRRLAVVRRDETGQGVLEVVLIAAGLAVLAIAAVTIIGAKVRATADGISTEVPGIEAPSTGDDGSSGSTPPGPPSGGEDAEGEDS